MINSKNDFGVASSTWAKAKANEIFNKMKGFKVSHAHSKKCAKEAVNVIIDIMRYEWNMVDTKWDQVLAELEKIELPKKVKK
jgi:hypothetical protein